MKVKKVVYITIIAIIITSIPISISLARNVSDEGKVLETNYTMANLKVKENMSGKELNINGKKVNTLYSYSMNEVDIYIDKNENEYLQKSGVTVGFIKAMEVEKQIEDKLREVEIDEKAALEIAIEYGKNNVDEFEKYTTLGVKFCNTYNEYQVYFNKMIDNCLTMDQIYITINKLGNITSFLADKQGMFDKYQGINIEENLVNERIEEFVNNKYGQELKKYKMNSKTLKMKNEKLVLECMVEIETHKDTNYLEGFDYYME